MRTVALLLLCAAVASADTVIEELSRPFFLEGDYPDRTLPVRIRFAKERGLPETITGFNVKEQVLCYARANGGEWTLLSRSGWTPWELTTWLPTSLLAKRGRLDVKVNVHGVDSRLFVAAIRPPPAQKPEILSLRPDRLELTDGSESVGMSLEFRHADEWGFVSVQLGKSGCALGRVDVEADDRGRVHFWFPKERLTKSALYPVTVTTRGGISEAVELRVGEDPIKLRETPVRPVRHESKGVVARPEAPDRRLGVHGNTLLLESDFRIERVVRQGGRGRLEFTPGKPDTKGADTVWVHFSPALPLPARLTGATVRFQSGTGLAVRHLHVWDGSRRILAEDRDARRPMNGTATVLLEAPYDVIEAITLSVGIILPRGTTGALWVDFTSASLLYAE